MIVILVIIFYIANFFFVKYLIILVYIRGVVVFILYISCLCWFINNTFNNFFLLFCLFVFYIVDLGLVSKFRDLGEHLWIYLFFRFLFNRLITIYCLNLFKISGSLRF
jgi:hypothetical protein